MKFPHSRQGKIKLSYHTQYPFRHIMVCKLCSLGMYCRKMALPLNKTITFLQPDVQKGYKILKMSLWNFKQITLLP
jgi:hypothetical protein